MAKSLREKLKCEANVPDRAIKPLLELYQQRVNAGFDRNMDNFVRRIKDHVV